MATKQDPEAAYQQLVKDLDQAVEAWRAAAPDAATEVPPQIKKIIERACKLADEHAGQDDEVRFLAFICKRPCQQQDALRMAVKRLADHAESKLIGDALDHLQSASFRDHGPRWLTLPHPSPRNNLWLAKNPWFRRQVLPELRRRVVAALA